MSRGSDVLLTLPALALEFTRSVTGHTDQHTLKWLLENRFNITRLDLAVDTDAPSVNPKLIADLWSAGHVRCKADGLRTWIPPTPKGQRPNSTGAGWTAYIGSPRSDRMMRIYDKGAEHEAKTGQRTFPHLTRFELQSRREHAHRSAQLIVDRGPQVIRPLLAGWLSLLDPRDAATPLPRRRLAPWWKRLMGEDRAYIKLQTEAATPARTMKHLKNNARSIALALNFNTWEEILAKVDDVEIDEQTLMKWGAFVQARNATRWALTHPDWDVDGEETRRHPPGPAPAPSLFKPAPKHQHAQNA